jgi:type IV pilus assembly protein PilM
MAFGRQNTRSVVGLDIEPGFLAAAELTRGPTPTLTSAATVALAPGLFHDGEVVEVDGLAEQIKGFFQEQKLSKHVRLGVANQRMVVRVFELPVIENEQELETAIRFQAQEELPMPLDQAVLDYRILERTTVGEQERLRVLVVAVRRDTVEHLLAATKKAGLVTELVDLAGFAIVRSLYLPLPESVPTMQSELGEENGEHDTANGVTANGSATIYCYVGGLTNLAIAVGTTCMFNRVLPNGFESMAAALAERMGLTLDHSRKWLTHVGLDRELETIEGDAEIIQEARLVLSNATRRIADEVRMSLEYYVNTVPDARRVERMVMAGPGMAIEGLPRMMEAEIGVGVEARSLGRIEVRPGALDDTDGARLTVAAGLALDEVPA